MPHITIETPGIVGWRELKVLVVHNKYRSRSIGGEDIVVSNEVDVLRHRIGTENVFTYLVSNDNFRVLKDWSGLIWSPRHYLAVFRMVKTRSIDVVHIHGFFPMLSASVLLAARRAGAKVVQTLHNYRWWCIAGTLYRHGHGVCTKCVHRRFGLYGVLYRCYRKSAAQSFVAAISYWFAKLVGAHKWVDRFFVLSQHQMEILRGIGVRQNRISLKPNMILELGVQSSEAQQRDGYVYVGRLDEAKGFDFLLDVWSKLGPEYGLTVIGTGPLDRKLLRRIPENITYLGRQSPESVRAVLSRARYLIHPSIGYETFGLVILEAFSVGTPVVAVAVGAGMDLVQDGYNGFISSPSDLLGVIRNSLHHPEYASLGRKAMETYRSYQRKTTVEKTIDLYRQLLGESRV